MISSRIHLLSGILATAFLLSSCSLTKNLPPDETVYMGADIRVLDRPEASSVDHFDASFKSIPLDGTKPGLGNFYVGLHNLFKKTRDRGFKHWVKNKLGRAPIIYRESIAENTRLKLKYYLNGKGFFSHQVTCDSVRNGRKVEVGCDVVLGKRYRIDSLVFPVDSTYFALGLDEKLQRAVLKEGEYYDRDRLDYERVRLSTMAGDIGFADFESDNVRYFVDTTVGDHKLDLYTRIVAPTDSTSHSRYLLDSILIYPNYTIDQSEEVVQERSIVDSNIYVIESNPYLDHALLDRIILQKPGKYYSRSEEKKTIIRLLDLGLFRFVNINNKPNTKFGKEHFVQEIYLTPERMQSISGELGLNNRSGNFLGVGASAKYQHRNIFGHAERFDFTVGADVETQFGDGVSFINSSDFFTTVRSLYRVLLRLFSELERLEIIFHGRSCEQIIPISDAANTTPCKVSRGALAINGGKTLNLPMSYIQSF